MSTLEARAAGVAAAAAPAGVFVHPRGLCESDQVGPGTRIWAFAHVLAGARVGRDCNVCDHAFIEGGAVVGDRVTVKNAVLVFDRVQIADDVFLGPNVVFTNDFAPRAEVRKAWAELAPTVVGRGATLGAAATVVCGTTLGSYCFVAAGAVVTRDVGAHALVAGNPARRIGWACGCGARLGAGLACACGRRYEPDPAQVVPAGLRTRPAAAGGPDVVGSLERGSSPCT